MGQLADRGSLQGQPSGARGELAGKCAPSEGRQYLPCAEQRQAGWASGAMKRGGAGVVRRAGFGTRRFLGRRGLGAVSGGAVLRRNRVRLVRHFWCYSGVVSGLARRNRFCSALGTARCALRSRSGVPGLWYRGNCIAGARVSRVDCGARKCGRLCAGSAP